MSNQESSGDAAKVNKRADGTVLEQSNAPRNPMKRMMDTSQESSKDDSQSEESKKQPVIRGDGTVLPERNEEQPRNRMKRVMDTSQEPEKEL